MTTYSCILLLLSLSSSPLWAGVLVDLSYGRSLSSTFHVGSSLPAEQQFYALSVDYTADMSQGLLRAGGEKYSLGLGIYTAQITYQSGNIKNTGGNFFVTSRLGWLVLFGSNAWLLQITPEFILFSLLSAASYSQSTIDDERFQSAALSTFKGHGALQLPVYVGKKMNWKLGKADFFLGGSVSYLMQDFSSKNDSVVATSPSTGKVNSITKSKSGDYQLRAMSLQIHATFML